MTTYAQVFLATAFTSRSTKEIDILEDCLFCITDEGVIVRVIHKEDSDYVQILKEYEHTENFHHIEDGSYLLPGFIDLHIHAAQWGQAGTALDIPLNDWLNTYTFPIEARFSDLEYAEKVYEDIVQTLLANGTTTALYFATVHKEASILLAKICAKRGQRGLVGKVVMDHPDETGTDYRDESTESALADTEEFIVAVKELAKTTKQGVYPVVTPRFIPSCTNEALQGLGDLAKIHDTHIQSHCSESDWAHQHVIERLGKNDAQALHDFGLLQDKTVMAHSNFLSDEDVQLFADTGSAIAHCPISNAYFANSVLPAAKFTAMGVDIGLGSDIAGGFSPSLYDNARQAVMSARMLEDGVNPDLPSDQRGVNESRITLNQAFYYLTAGGGESLSLPIGRLEEGYAWDVQRINTVVPTARLPLFDDEIDLDILFQKILYLVRPENIQDVWVQGELVHSRR